jgi:Inner membrane protein CreD
MTGDPSFGFGWVVIELPSLRHHSAAVLPTRDTRGGHPRRSSRRSGHAEGFADQAVLILTLFAMLLTSLYSALYGMLVSEDNALLLGSLLVFAMLVAVMTLTRKLDWYSLRPQRPDGAA